MRSAALASLRVKERRNVSRKPSKSSQRAGSIVGGVTGVDSGWSAGSDCDSSGGRCQAPIPPVQWTGRPPPATRPPLLSRVVSGPGAGSRGPSGRPIMRTLNPRVSACGLNPGLGSAGPSGREKTACIAFGVGSPGTASSPVGQKLSPLLQFLPVRSALRSLVLPCMVKMGAPGRAKEGLWGNTIWATALCSPIRGWSRSWSAGSSAPQELAELIESVDAAAEAYVPRLRYRVIDEGRYSLKDLADRESRRLRELISTFRARFAPSSTTGHGADV